MRTDALTIICYTLLVVAAISLGAIGIHAVNHNYENASKISELEVSLAAAQKENRDREGKCAYAYILKELMTGDGKDVSGLTGIIPRPGKGG